MASFGSSRLIISDDAPEIQKLTDILFDVMILLEEFDGIDAPDLSPRDRKKRIRDGIL